MAFLEKHCLDCHESDDPKGDVALDGLEAVTSENAKTWDSVFTQIALDEMPPKKKKRPDPERREAMIEWTRQALKAVGHEVIPPGGDLPAFGNLIDHERLFSGRINGPAWSPPRFWRRNQSHYDALMEDLWVIPAFRYEKAVRRSDPKWAAYSYSKPFPGMEPGEFTDYSSGVHADDATLRALMNAGSQIAERMTSEKPAYSKEIQPWNDVGVPHLSRGHPFARFGREPPTRPPEFEPFLKKEAKPEPGEIAAAVRRVFRIFLDRNPRPEEAGRYEGLLRKSCERGSPVVGLRGLITAMVVSPEFVFRLEIGRSPPDEHGRRILSPNELV
ncbi:MAG: c-type cytochrome domain-containing protein, partial [Verrucomicrobiota bacterium]